MKKFILLGIFLFIAVFNIYSQEKSNYFGIQRLDSLIALRKTLKIEIDSCQTQILRTSDNSDIVERLKISQDKMAKVQQQIRFIKKIKGIKIKE